MGPQQRSSRSLSWGSTLCFEDLRYATMGQADFLDADCADYAVAASESILVYAYMRICIYTNVML